MRVYVLQFTGEAARHVPPETRANYLQPPWNDIVGMRHRLVHDYRNVNVVHVWETVQAELPIFVATLEEDRPSS